MSFWWLIPAFFGGTFAGVILLGLMAGGAHESAYRAGYQEGHAEGRLATLRKLADQIKSKQEQVNNG